MKRRRKRSITLDRKCLKYYGLMITALDSETGDLIAVTCRFCYYFGRETPDRRMKTMNRVNKAKHWSNESAFRTENFTYHLSSQNPIKWKKCKSSSDEDKSKCFNVHVPFLEIITAHYSIP